MIKEDLLKIYSRKVELHCHSMPASDCCHCTMERFSELYSERGVEAVCLTNHFCLGNSYFKGKTKKECIDLYLADYERLKELAKPYGIKIILGCEIRFNENCNDYLIYGVNRDILEESYDYLQYDLKTYRENVSLKDSLFVQAHPFRDNIIPASADLLDGIETLNFHPNHNSRNSSSAIYAKENGIGICTGGSDFHYERDYAPAALLMLSKVIPEDSFQLAKILKTKDYVFLLGGNHIILP